jgi:YHS domain-containing protein
MQERTEATRTLPVPGGEMRLTIGAMGGAAGVMSRDVLDRAHALGRAIATSGCILVTGACPGLPQASACGANQAGGMVVGISPGLSLDEHVHKYGSPTDFHDVLIFTGSGTEHHLRPSCFCDARTRGKGDAAAGMERDPVCGMLLRPEAAAAERHVEGRRYVFCSLACVQRFDGGPPTPGRGTHA